LCGIRHLRCTHRQIGLFLAAELSAGRAQKIALRSRQPSAFLGSLCRQGLEPAGVARERRDLGRDMRR